MEFHRGGRFSEAMSLYSEILRLDRDDAQVLYLLGSAHLQIGQPTDAIGPLERAVGLQPDNATVHNNYGAALRELGRPIDALKSFERGLELEPKDAELHNNRATALQVLGRLDDAIAAYDVALSLNPNYPEAFLNRGTALEDLGRLGEALMHYDQALELRPDFPEAHYNRGNVMGVLKRTAEALASFDRARELKPDYAEAHWNKALTLISAGRYIEGWELYEWRIKKATSDEPYPTFPRPSWRGREDLHGRTLFVHSEQGLGDVIQFCRYLPLVHDRGMQVVFEAPVPLIPLVSTLACDMTVVAQGSMLPHFDAYCPLLSLPYSFGTTLETVPIKIPYLSGDPGRVEWWQRRLGSRDRFRVGVAWSGTTGAGKLGTRSIPLETLISATALPIECHSLQVKYQEGDLQTLERNPEIRQHQEELVDFAETAALIECLDLVISIDTSVAHVAGALGKPVWVLLAFDADYRWMLEREDSPWYPTARLFRQPTPGDWQSVIACVTEALEAKLSERSPVKEV
ncbi:MAG: tetratricopeptide repeat-containing glycosyltransferase family protein [Pseudomonadota bacterium]|nr:tetratricopeptide repeat-containing glycosyltransferase family protein [Pseudomonadota bacterium]